MGAECFGHLAIRHQCGVEIRINHLNRLTRQSSIFERLLRVPPRDSPAALVIQSFLNVFVLPLSEFVCDINAGRQLLLRSDFWVPLDVGL